MRNDDLATARRLAVLKPATGLFPHTVFALPVHGAPLVHCGKTGEVRRALVGDLEENQYYCHHCGVPV